MATIFEKIINREIPAEIIYEDEKCIVFLDITPINKGHALVVPKELSVNILDIQPDTLTHLAVTAKKVGHALMETLEAAGINLIMNNGEAAGQEVPHTHIHVVPRFKDDNVFQTPKHASYTEGEMQEFAKKIANALG